MSLRKLLIPIVVTFVAAACTPADPPTITAPPADQPGAQPVAPGQSIEITVPPPPLATVVVPPITIGERSLYIDADRAFSIDLPVGWTESRQEIVEGANDVKLGTVFASPESNGLLSITMFDNGQRPASLGVTTNQVLKLTGWTELQDFQELRRENVIQREGEALRLDVTYTRNNGIAMHSLVLFQIDGTTFSMVNLGVERGSYNENEGTIREILDSYRVPGVGQPDAAGDDDADAADAADADAADEEDAASDSESTGSEDGEG